MQKLKNKGCDEDGREENFQRAGGWCEPEADVQELITSEPEARKAEAK